jgi:PAS domain-containing protein
MSSPLFADQPVPQPERGAVDSLITQTRRLRVEVDAVRRDTGRVLASADDENEDDILWRWRRALCDLAVHQLDDLGAHLGQLREGRPADPWDFGRPYPEQDGEQAGGGAARHGHGHAAASGAFTGRVGSAEWDLLTDEVSWSDELFTLLERPVAAGPMSLDELPSVVFPEDRPLLTALVTGCLIDGRPIDGEFRVVRPDGRLRTVHMMGEPVLDATGRTASMWAVLRDISDLRRGERALRESGDSLSRDRQAARAEHRVAAEFHEAVRPSRAIAHIPDRRGTARLEAAVACLPAHGERPFGGEWHDVLELPCSDTLLAVGELTGHGVGLASSLVMLRGALRGIALTGAGPGALLGHLGVLADTLEQPVLGSLLCCRYTRDTRMLSWAGAGHPAPVLLRDGTVRVPAPPEGPPLGAAPGGSAYEQADMRLLPGDVLVLGAGAHAPGSLDALRRLAPAVARAADARACAGMLADALRSPAAAAGQDACAVPLVARAS